MLIQAEMFGQRVPLSQPKALQDSHLSQDFLLAAKHRTVTI